MANLFAQTLLPNGKIDNVTFTTVNSTDTHSFYNSGYTVLLVQADSAAVATLSFVDRKSMLTGTVEAKTLATGAVIGSTSLTYGHLPRHFNKLGTTLVDFSVDVACNIAIVQIPDVTYLASEFISHSDLLNPATPGAPSTAGTLSAAGSMSIPLDGSTIVVGGYVAAGGATLEGDEGAADTGVQKLHDFTVSPVVGDIFMSYPAQSGFGGSCTVDAVGDVTIAAFSLDSADVKANS